MLTPYDELLDRQRIADVLNRYATGVDTCDWVLFRSIFEDEVELDFSALHGAQPPQVVAADEWVKFCRTVTPGFDATQHALTNMSVTFDGDTAVVRVYVHAVHYLVNDSGDNTSSIGGYYTHHLRRHQLDWRISKCKLTPTWQSGHPKLFEMAAERVARGLAKRT